MYLKRTICPTHKVVVLFRSKLYLADICQLLCNLIKNHLYRAAYMHKDRYKKNAPIPLNTASEHGCTLKISCTLLQILL